MRDRFPTRLFVFALGVALLFGAQPASAIGGLFKKPDKKVPTGDELRAQEGEAGALLGEARSSQSSGNSSRALSTYDTILKQYPFTQAAAEAAYAKAMLMRDVGKLNDAFDAFQKLITDYRSSPRFSDAIEKQFELAEEAKGGRKQKSLIGIPMKLGTEDVIKMYRSVITNAPFGKFAPLAQFSIGEVYQDRGEKELAVAAYQGVVDNYPTTPQASEAQFRIGAISNIAAKRSEDTSNLTATRDALTTYVAANPSGERASEAESILTQVNEAEATQSLQIGKFYEQQGKVKAAAIYYNEALKYGSSEASAEARDLLSQLSQKDPQAIVGLSTQPTQDFTPPGASDLRQRSDYAGPPSPELARLSQKPAMRTERDDFMPIPLQEPSLPVRPGAGTGTSPGSLLPPVDTGDRPPLLTIPPIPDAPPMPPVPAIPAPPVPEPPPAPAPEDAKPAIPSPPLEPAPAAVGEPAQN